MAQDAELKLKVSLDLAFFRQQLNTIGAQLGGQSLQLSIQFNKKSIADQYRLLNRYLEAKTFKVKVESPTLDVLVQKVSTFKKNLIALGNEKIDLAVNVTSNIDETRKSIKEKLSSVEVKTQLADPVNVDDFIRGVAKKVDDQVKKSYTAGGIPIATKLALPGLADPLKALQKNLNQKDPLRAKVGTTPSIQKSDVTAFKTAVSEKFKDITVKVKAELETATAAAQGATAGPSRTFLQELKDLDKSVLQSIYKAAGKDALLAFDEGIINNKTKMAQALNKAAEDASAGFIAALESKKSALFKAAGEYGGALLGGLRKTLKIQSPSREMFDIGDDAGKGFELGLLKALELAEKSATNQMRRMLDRLARMALMMGGMSAAAINRQVAQSRALPSVNFPATVPPRQSIPIGPSSTGRSLPAGRAAAGLIGSAQAPAGLLPSATTQGGLTTGLEALIQSLVSQTRGRGPEGPGAIVSMETGFIPAMRERFAKAAERYLFGVETQVMDLFDAALRQVESAVDLHIAKIQGQISQRMRSAFSVVDLGVQGRPMLPGAATGQTPLMLPAAGGTTPLKQMRFNAVRTGEVVPPTSLMLPPAGGTTPRREMRFNAVTSTGGRGGGYVPPGGFPEEGMLGMLGGRQGPATFIGAGSQMVKLKTDLDATVQSMERFRKTQIPLAGAIQELAGEFGNAAQQVLLYGTAYKALAFFVNLPNQALNAAKSLQTFNNQLNAITGSSENADRAFAFVDNLAARFNVPLESARQGFVKLYASMAPAGFSSGEIENLFTGISKASATLGLSSDKVDRVTYAFSQMASKGQLMSEEVSGQLGDVIPGALSIMAEAARMDIATFKKAMEDGAFVGETFKQVMSNVPIVLENRFGKGAAGAAKTLQGSMNALAISTQKFYESFEPIVSMGAASIFPVIATAINDAAQAVQAFTTAMQGNTTPAQMLEGNAAQIYGVLQQLREVFVAVAEIIQGIAPTLMIAGKAFLTTAEYIAKLVNTPIGGFLADLAVKAGIALIAIQLFAKTGIVGLISQLILLQRSTAAAGGGLLTFASTLTKTATAAKLFRLAMTGLIGAGILFGIEALVNAIGRMANRLSDARKNAIAARDAIKSMNAADLGEQIIIQQNKLQALSRVQKAGGKVGSEKDRQILEQMGMKLTATGGTFVGGQLIGGQYKVDKNLIESFRIREQEQLKAIQDQRKSLYDTTPLPLNEVELGAGKGSDKELNKAAEDARKLADDKRKYEADLMKISSQQAINLNEMEFDHWKNLQQAKYDFLEAGQNEWMSRELKFQRDLQAIEIRRIEAIRKARIETVKAETDAQASAYIAGDSGAGGGAIFGDTGRAFNGRGWVHGHFQNMNREALVQDTVEVVMKLLAQGVRPELGSGQKFSGGMQQAQVEQLVRRGIASHKPYPSGIGAVDIFVPQGTKVPVGLTGVSDLGGNAGVSGNLPRGTQLMHLDPRSRSGAIGAASAGVPASRIRAEARKDYASALASQEAINAKEKEGLGTKYANIQAQQELNILIREYTASIVPVEQQKLENTLLQNRIALISSGAFGDALDTEQKINEIREKAALGVQMANKQIAENNKLVDAGILKQEEANKLNTSQVEKIKQLTQGLEAYIPLLRERLQLEQSSAEATLRGEITRATPLGGMGLSAGFIGPAAQKYEEALGRGASEQEASRFAELQNQLTLLEARNEAVKQSIYGIGNAFGEAMTTGVTSLIAGTATAKEVFANFLQSVAQALSQAAAQMIATYIAIGIAKIFAGLSSATTSATGPNPGGIPSTGNVTAPSVNGFDAGSLANVAANGAYFTHNAAAFASGGAFTNSIVSGPTMFKFADGGAMNLGLMGEAGPEAIMPLKRGPDGRLGVSMYDASRRAVANAEGNAGVSSIDYEDEFSIGGASASKRSAAASAAQAMTATRLQVMEQRTISERRSEMRQIQEMVAQPAKINVEYQSQVINNVEYVTREQAERMAAQSALRGRELAIGSLQNSVKTRKRVGMG